MEALGSQNLTLAAYSVLMVLGEVRESTQRGLADAVGVDPRNLVPILDDLEARALVTRQAHPHDRRRHTVKLSATGRKQLNALAELVARAESELLRPLTRQERRQLHSLLARLLPDVREN